MAKRLETYRGIAYPWHCDQMGHVNVQHYMAMYDQASVHLFSAFGLTYRHLRETRMGFADVRHVIEYKNELHPGCPIRMESRLLKIGTKSIHHEHRLLDAETNQEVATFEAVSVYFDLERRKAVPFPPEIRAKVEAMLEEGED